MITQYLRAHLDLSDANLLVGNSFSYAHIHVYTDSTTLKEGYDQIQKYLGQINKEVENLLVGKLGLLNS